MSLILYHFFVLCLSSVINRSYRCSLALPRLNSRAPISHIFTLFLLYNLHNWWWKICCLSSFCKLLSIKLKILGFIENVFSHILSLVLVYRCPFCDDRMRVPSLLTKLIQSLPKISFLHFFVVHGKGYFIFVRFFALVTIKNRWKLD